MSKKKLTKAVDKEQVADSSLLEEVQYSTSEGWGVPVWVETTGDTVWATQCEIAAYFGVTRPTIGEHLKKIFREGELAEDSTCRKFRLVLPTGRFYNTLHYNLDVILHVGFKVNSKQASAFRRWADKILKQYIVKGFALNEARLREDPQAWERARAELEKLRSEELDLYKILRHIAHLACDYDKDDPDMGLFFGTMQNQFLYAVSGEDRW